MPPVYEQPDSLVIPLEIRLDQRLCPEVIACIDDGLAVYSKAYRSAFSRINHGQRNLNQLIKDLQKEYGLKSRTANSIARDAKARHQAGLELAKEQTRNLQASILRKKKRMKKLKKAVEENSRKAAAGQLNDNELLHYRKQKHDLWRLGQLIPGLEAKLKRWKKDIGNRHVRLCFGTKKLFKAQYHLEENGLSSHEEWKEMFVRRRDRMMYRCGKNDEKNGNQLCHLIRMKDGSWKIGVLPVLKPERGQDRIITGPVKITHTPGLELLNQVFDGYEADQPVKQAISVRILRRKKGYYVQFFLHLPKPDGWNTSSFEGVIGLDFNADHIALCETDRYGNIIYARREWKEMFIRNRDRMMYLCGKNDEKNGNQLCHLIRMEDSSWQIGILPVLKPKKGQDRIVTGSVKITHAPGLKLLSQVFDGYEADLPAKQAISVRILRRKKGYYVQFFLYLPKSDGWNTSSFEGVIGLDFNADHIALCETDRNGNVIYARRIGLAGLGRKNHNYGQGIDRMKTVIKKITAEARFKGKDLIIEDLDFCVKKSDLQKNKTYNRMITQLACSQYTQAIKRRCFKDIVDLKIVNPAYTSKKAKETVCRELGMSIHLGAACMIARRGLGLF